MADVLLAKSPLPLAQLAGADAATDGQVPTSDGAGGVAWETQAGGASAATVIHAQDQKTSGTAGGTFTSGAWQTRTLNTAVTNDISGASLASNQVTLPAGTFEVWAAGTVNQVDFHQMRLRDITNAVTLLTGRNDFASASNSGATPGTIVGRFTLASSAAIELQHRCTTTKTSSGLGVACSFGTEVYADMFIRKVA